MSTSIVQAIAGEPRVSSEIIAERTDVQHKNVIGYIRDNAADFEAFGEVAFETRPGYNNAQVTIAHLNEQQATLLMTFMRNSHVVKAFKIELVRQFFEMRQALTSSVPALTEDEKIAEVLGIMSGRMKKLEAKVIEDAPKVEYVDTFVADEDLTILRNIAKPLGIGEAQLRQALIGHRWIYKEETKRWSDKEQKKVPYYRYSPYADKRDYFRCVKNHDAPRFKDEIQHTLKVTPQGAAAIARMAKQWGLIA